jgi:hypothetical protein
MPAFKSTAKSPEIHYVTVIKEENLGKSVYIKYQTVAKYIANAEFIHIPHHSYNYLTYDTQPTQVSVAPMHINCFTKVCH